VVLRPDLATENLPFLQFFAANAVRHALENVSGKHVRLKWPNDLVIDESKLGGILVESKTKGSVIQFVVIGTGLNVNQRKPQLPPGAISLLLASGIRHNLRTLLQAILDQMQSDYHGIDDRASIMAEWWRNCIHRPPKVEITLPRGIVTGITRGIDSEGSLLVETDDRRIETVSEGTLRVVSDTA